MSETLRQLASFVRDHDFDRSAPPDLRETFLRHRATLGSVVTLGVQARDTPAGPALRPVLDHDPTRLVRHVWLYARTPGHRCQRTSETQAVFPAPAGERVDYYATAMGPGGAVVASFGSRQSPRSIVHAPRAASPRPRATDPGDRRGGAIGPGVWVGVGAAGVLALGVVLGVVLSSGESDVSRPSPPTVLGF